MDFALTLSRSPLQARHNDLPIDAHFSGNLLQSYKPNPVMYCRASELLGFDAAAREAGHVAMFASHVEDLIAAKQQGVRSVSLSLSTFSSTAYLSSIARVTKSPLYSSIPSTSAAQPRTRAGVTASKLSPREAKST